MNPKRGSKTQDIALSGLPMMRPNTSTEEQPEVDVLVRNVKKSFDELLALNPHIGKDVVFTITTSTDPVFLSEYIPANLLFRFEDKQG